MTIKQNNLSKLMGVVQVMNEDTGLTQAYATEKQVEQTTYEQVTMFLKTDGRLVPQLQAEMEVSLIVGIIEDLLAGTKPDDLEIKLRNCYMRHQVRYCALMSEKRAASIAKHKMLGAQYIYEQFKTHRREIKRSQIRQLSILQHVRKG